MDKQHAYVQFRDTHELVVGDTVIVMDAPYVVASTPTGDTIIAVPRKWHHNEMLMLIGGIIASALLALIPTTIVALGVLYYNDRLHGESFIDWTLKALNWILG